MFNSSVLRAKKCSLQFFSFFFFLNGEKGRNYLYDSSERRRTAAALIIWHCFSLCSQLPEHVSFSSSAKEEFKQALYAKLERSTGVTSTNPHYQGSHGAALNGSCLSSDGSS